MPASLTRRSLLAAFALLAALHATARLQLAAAQQRSVLDYGAAGDGWTDDSAAFEASLTALAEQGGGTLLVPAGSYVLFSRLAVTAANVVIQGDGSSATHLHFQEGAFEGVSDGSAGAALEFRGSDQLGPASLLGTVTAGVARGGKVLLLAAPGGAAVQPRQLVRLTARSPATGCQGGRVSLSATVSSVSGRTVVLTRGLPFDMSAVCKLELHDLTASLPLQRVGVQGLTLHLQRASEGDQGPLPGSVGVSFANAATASVRDVSIVNADTSVSLSNAHTLTVDGVAVWSGSTDRAGSWGLSIQGGSDVVVSGFDAASASTTADIALTGSPTTVTIRDCKGADLSVDLSRANPYGLLLLNNNFGQASRPWGQPGPEHWPLQAVIVSRGGADASGQSITGPNIAAPSSMLRPPAPVVPRPPPAQPKAPAVPPAVAAPVAQQPTRSPTPSPPAVKVAATLSAPPLPLVPPPAQPTKPAAAAQLPSSPPAKQAPATPTRPAASPKPPSPSSPAPPKPASPSPAAANPQAQPPLSPSPAPKLPAPAPAPVPAPAKASAYGCNGGSRCSVGVPAEGLPVCLATTFTSPSRFFGCTGEAWNPAAGPDARLPVDWSFAGVNQGVQPLPEVPVVANVRDYGAVGDGEADDSEAFEAAVVDTKVKAGAIFIPAGTYRLTRRFNIRKAILLKGAGRDATTLLFPQSLTELYGNTWSEGYAGSGTSDYAHSAGFLNWWGWDPVSMKWSFLADITSPAPRGAQTLQVASTSSLAVGQWVRVNLDDPGDGSLFTDLASGQPGAFGANQRGTTNVIRHLSRIAALGPDWIKLERPVIANVSLAYKPTLHRWMPLLQQAGLEDLTIAFPATPAYNGHLKELGNNAVHFNMMVNSRMRRVRIHNSDSAFYSWGSAFCTLEGVEVSADSARGAISGHRGLWFERGSDNLVRDFVISTTTHHDLSVSFAEQATAFVNGSGVDVNFDHHRATPFGNLFSNIDVGLGSRPFYSTGDAKNGPNTGGFSTFWNIKSKLPIKLPPPTFGPAVTFVGLTPVSPDAAAEGLGWVLERLPRPVSPADLVEGMRSSRGARLARVGGCC